MNKLRILGDVHGLWGRYLEQIRGCDYSIQLGDFGFDYKCFLQQHIDAEKHKFFFGNHDNHNAKRPPNWMGRFGEFKLNSIAGYYISGAASVDKADRLEYQRKHGTKIWWKEEELTWAEAEQCFNEYCLVKPELVITHDCPESISKVVGNPNVLKFFGLKEDWTCTTQLLLQKCFEYWQPKLWLYGHMHINSDITELRTRFVCVNQNSYIDIDDNLNIINKS